MQVKFDRLNQWRISDAQPQHRETLSSFEIGKYEVTAKEFCRFLNEQDLVPCIENLLYTNARSTVLFVNGIFTPREGYELAPATHVQYFGAVNYCAWLSKTTGRNYRLPTEVEWEYAARGSEGRIYPWGNSNPLDKGFYWIHYRSSLDKEALYVTTVGMFPDGATPEGVNDLIGNAYEWCSNFYAPYSETGITDNPEEYIEYMNVDISSFQFDG